MYWPSIKTAQAHVRGCSVHEMSLPLCTTISIITLLIRQHSHNVIHLAIQQQYWYHSRSRVTTPDLTGVFESCILSTNRQESHGGYKWDTNGLNNSLWDAGVLWLENISVVTGQLHAIPQHSDTVPQTSNNGCVLCTQFFQLWTWHTHDICKIFHHNK